MSTWPIDANGISYDHQSFEGRNYVSRFPELLSDLVAQMDARWLGYVYTPYSYLPALGYVEFQGPRRRLWGAGDRLYFQRMPDSPSDGLTGKFTVLLSSYDESTGVIKGLVDGIYAHSSAVSAVEGTKWLVRPCTLSATATGFGAGLLPVASGGLNADLVQQPFLARVAGLNIGSPYLTVAELWEDFESELYSTNHLFPWNVIVSGATINTAVNVSITRQNTLGIARFRTTNLNDTAILRRLAGSTGEMLFSHNFEAVFRVYIPTLSDGTHRNLIQIGFGGIGSTWTASTSDMFVFAGLGFEYDVASSANWRIVTAGGGSATRTNTATAVTAGAWVKLGMSKVGGTVTFTVNGVSVGTHTTLFPTTFANTNNICQPAINVRRTLGSSANRDFLVDYFWCLFQAPSRV